MAKTPKKQIELGQVNARQTLEMENVLNVTATRLASVLEGPKAGNIRKEVDQALHNYLFLKVGDVEDRLAINYEWEELKRCRGLKAKITYIASLIHAAQGPKNAANELTGLDDATDIRDEDMQNILNDIIKGIEKKLLNNSHFSEDMILLMAASSRAEIEMTDAEHIELNALGTRLQTLCKVNRLDDLADSTHFTNETTAQRILKISDVILQLSANGLHLDDAKLETDFKKFREKLKPLEDLDLYFKHMTKVVNALHGLVVKGYHSAIRPEQQAKLDKVLVTLDMKTVVNETLKKYNQIENFGKNEEQASIDRLRQDISQHPKFNEALYSAGISEAQASEYFFSSSMFKVTTEAKRLLDHQKDIVFGAKRRDFDRDVAHHRGEVKNNIFRIADEMGESGDLTNAQFEEANNLFEHFPNIFFAREQDNYKKTDNDFSKLHYHKMEKVLSAIMRRRVPALRGKKIQRRGSGMRILEQFVENALKAKNRGLMRFFRRKRHSADDASVFAMIIMAQNTTKNEIFYQNMDKSKKHDRWFSKILSKLSFVKRGRDELDKSITPMTTRALRTTENIVKQTLKIGSGAVKIANKVGSQSTRGLTWAVGTASGRFNDMMKKGGYKAWKTPFYLLYPFTATIKPIVDLGNQGATYMYKNGTAGMNKVETVTEDAYNRAIGIVKGATGEEVTHLTDGIRYAVKGASNLIAQGISKPSKRIYNSLTTAEERGVLGALYAAAKEDHAMFDLMQSSELRDMLNLTERGPFLFNKDGRTGITEDHKDRYPENDIGEKNVKKDVLGKKHDDIQGQFNNFMETFQKKWEEAEDKITETTAGTPAHEEATRNRDNLVTTLDTRTAEKGDINDLLLVIQQFAIGTIGNPTDFDRIVKDKVDIMGGKRQASKLLIDNPEAVDETQRGFQQKIEAKQKEIDDENVELNRVEDKMKNNVHEGDLTYSERSGERDTKQSEIDDRELLILDEQKKLAIKQGERGKLDSENKEKLNGPYGEIKKATEKQNTLEEKKDAFLIYKSELEDIEIKLDPGYLPALTAREKGDLEKKQTKVLEDKRKLCKDYLGSRTDEESITQYLETQQKKITAMQDRVIDNTSKMAILDSEIQAINRRIKNMENDINKRRIRIDEITKKLEGKSESDKSRNDYDADKKHIKQKIERLGREKDKLTKDMHKEQAKEKVYNKIKRRGDKVRNLSKTLKGINDDPDMSQKDKSKLFINQVKISNLDFGLKKENSAEYIAQNKAATMDVLNSSQVAPTTPVTPETPVSV